MEEIQFKAKVAGIVKGYEYDDYKVIRLSSKQEFPFSRKYGQSRYYSGCIGGLELPLDKGLDIIFTAKINKGKYLNCISWKYAAPSNTSQLEKYLYNKLKGLISKAAIGRLVGDHGMSTLSLFKNGEKEALSPYFNMNKSINLVSAIDIIQNTDNEEKFVESLLQVGVNTNVAKTIYKAFGKEAFDLAKTNPYRFIEVDGVGFKTCENIARLNGVALDSKERILEGTSFILNNCLCSKGDLFMGKVELAKTVIDTLGHFDLKRFEDVINENLKSSNPRFFCYDGKIMDIKDAHDELVASRNIINLSKDQVKFDENEVNQVIEDVVSANPFRLSDRQIEAVKNSLMHKMSIITGGPGTGKTSIVTAIIKSWSHLSTLPVICLAPTGKAASRMKEVTGMPAQTIHKALKLRPGSEEVMVEQLPQALVIIDESSMIDQFVCSALLRAITRGSTVIFVGDICQLPSVGKGDVLNQMIKSKAIYVSKLTETFRQKKGSLIIDNAKKINEGDCSLEYGEGFSLVELEDNNLDYFKKVYLYAVKKHGLDNVAVLCPRRKSGEDNNLNMVSDNMNVILQEILNPISEGKVKAKIKSAGGIDTTFTIGDRVMSWKNTEEASNGDVGVIQNIENNEDGETLFTILWESGEISNLTSEEMKNISLAYSMSIHKSQGSEYSCVIMPFLKEHKCNLFQRNLLYTGVTRAKKECIIVGDKESIDYCISHEVTGTRNSFLSERLERWVKEEK